VGVLEGRTAIVTGAGRGIGGAIARRFAAEGGRAVADAGDVADAATGARLVETAVERFGGLHVVVNAAGIVRDRMIFNMSDAEWDDVIRVHLRGHFTVCRAAAAHFRARRSGQFRIINFTSHSGLQGSPGQANYAAAKMGVVGLTYSLAQGLARYGVTANAAAPSAATRLVATVPDERRAVRDRPADDDPRRSPDNVAALALYLASTRSGWLTGRVLENWGFDIGLYANPTVVATASATAPWTFDGLAEQLEGGFRPLADGLPESLFADQTRRP